MKKKLTKIFAFLASFCFILNVAACKDTPEKDSLSTPTENSSTPASDSSDSSSETDNSSSANPTTPPENSSSSSSSQPERAEYAYKITVQTEKGYVFPNTTVQLFNGTTKVAEKLASVTGIVIFEHTDVSVGEYKIEVTGVPEGYVFAGNTQPTTPAIEGAQIDLKLKPNGSFLSGTPASGKKYELGDIMHDFTITDTDGNTHTLSQLLREKEAVVLNFWFASCGPCNREFPYINEAYNNYWDEENKIAYSDKMEILAISIQDSRDSVITHKNNMGLQFPMFGKSAGAEVTNRFSIFAAPTTIIIDRNGVLCFCRVGSFDSTSQIEMFFNFYLGDNYKTTILSL